MLISMRNEGLIHNMTYLNIWGKKMNVLFGEIVTNFFVKQRHA